MKINEFHIKKNYEMYFPSCNMCYYKSGKKYDYNGLLDKKLKVKDLNEIKKQYGIILSKKKQETIIILYKILKIWESVNILVDTYRKHLYNRYYKLQNLVDFVNDEDFESLESLSDCNKLDLITIKEEVSYGFNIESLGNLVKSYKQKAFNPYTRNILSKETHGRLEEITSLRKILKLNKNEENIVFSEEKDIEFKLLDVFNRINTLGNYADSDWLSELSSVKIIKFLRELQDIWEYRANLSNSTKRAIYTDLNPFFDMNISSLQLKKINIIKRKAIEIINRLIKSTERESAALGAFYVLGALTLVNEDAAVALPWLYQSMYHT